MLANENTVENDVVTETDSDENIEGNDAFIEKQKKRGQVPLPTVMLNVDSPNEVVDIAPGEGQLPVSFTSEPGWESLDFVRNFSTSENHFKTEKKVRIILSTYLHVRLKCCDGRFASDPQYVFQALDWIEGNAVASTVHFTQRKQFQTDFTVGCLQNQDNAICMIIEDQTFVSFKGIQGTPQYFHNVILDVLEKIRQYGLYTFFLTCLAAEFECPYIIQVINCTSLCRELSDEVINTMDWDTKFEKYYEVKLY